MQIVQRPPHLARGRGAARAPEHMAHVAWLVFEQNRRQFPFRPGFVETGGATPKLTLAGRPGGCDDPRKQVLSARCRQIYARVKAHCSGQLRADQVLGNLLEKSTVHLQEKFPTPFFPGHLRVAVGVEYGGRVLAGLDGLAPVTNAGAAGQGELQQVETLKLARVDVDFRTVPQCVQRQLGATHVVVANPQAGAAPDVELMVAERLPDDGPRFEQVLCSQDGKS